MFINKTQTTVPLVLYKSDIQLVAHIIYILFGIFFCLVK